MSEVMRKERSGVAGGLILIGIGVLLLTGGGGRGSWS